MTALVLNESNPATSGIQPVPANAGTGPATFNSAQRIITFAMRNAGYLDVAEDPTSDDYALYMPRLNDLVNYLQTQGLKLWLQEDVAFTPVQGYNCYQFGPTATNTVAGTFFTYPKPLRFVEGFWQDVNGNRRPLIVLSRNEWDYLSTLTQQGAINSYFTDKQQNFVNLWLWLTPDNYSATMGQIHMIAQVQVNNLISLTDAMNFPQEWFIALHWGLADEISTGQPTAIIGNCRMQAEKYRAALEAWDVEDASTVFQPDQRTQYVANRFA